MKTLVLAGATPRKRTTSVRRVGKSQTQEKPASVEKRVTPPEASRVACVLCAAGCVDIVAMIALSPLIVMFTQALSITVVETTVAQLLYLVPQIFSTFVAERLAIRFGGMTSYSLTLFAASGCALLSTAALHRKSVHLYLLSRALAGFLRHSTTVSTVVRHQYPEFAQHCDVRKYAPYALGVAVVVGGMLGDLFPDISLISGVMALLELCAAVAVGVVAFIFARTPKVVPSSEQLSCLRDWLFQQPSRKFVCLLPVALLGFCASIVQSLYPSIDRRIFNFPYSVVGVHMLVDTFMQIFVAPIVVKAYGVRYRLLACTCSFLFVLGMWASSRFAKHGMGFYFVVSTLLTDLPAAVLQSSLAARVAEDFGAPERELAQRTQIYTRRVMKQWQPTLFMIVQVILPDEKDINRLVGVPLGLGVMMFIVSNRIDVSVVAIAVGCAAFAYFSPINDEGMMENLSSMLRWEFPVFLVG